MLSVVWQRRPSYNNDGAVASSKVKSLAKFV
jgi:hypothetical protein